MIRTWTIAAKAGALVGAGVLSITAMLAGCSAGQEKSPANVQPPPVAHAVPKPEATTVAKPVMKVADQPPPEPADEPKPEKAKPTEKATTPQEAFREDLEEMADKPRDLGTPLVDANAELVRLSAEQPVWVDKKNKHVVLLGETCKAGYPLEFFATYSNRAYESVVAVNVKPSTIHAGLLAVGAKPGHPARFQPEFSPPTGTEIAIEVRWKDPQGQVQSARAQDWIRDIKTKKALDLNWVFAGSIAETDSSGQIASYQADGGDMICVLSLPSAMLDLPRRGYGAIESRSFEAFAERVPREGTPVTLLMKPIKPAKPSAPQTGAKTAAQDPAEAEKRAVEAAGPWLALIDQGQYGKSWEAASDRFKDAAERRDFIAKLNDARKPLGNAKSRVLLSKHYTTSLPGAPDGHYVILKYQTVFEKKAAVETVTSMLDKDRKWRISGYSIK